MVRQFLKFSFLIALFVFNVSSVFAGGDSMNVNHHCELIMQDGSKKEAYIFTRPLHYDATELESCDVRNLEGIEAFDMIFNSDEFNLENADVKQRDFVNHKKKFLSSNEYTSTEHIFLIEQSKIKSSTGKFINNKQKPNIISNKDLNLLRNSEPKAIYGFGRNDVFAGPLYVLISFSEKFQKAEDLEKLYFSIYNDIYRNRKSKFKYENPKGNIAERRLKYFSDKDTAARIEMNKPDNVLLIKMMAGGA